MSEEDLRIQQIKMKIKGLTFEQAREISNLCSEYYIEGLEQSLFDKRMLEVELSGYRQAILQDKELMGLKEDKDKLQQENKQLKAIEKEHQKINGELREENERLQEQKDFWRKEFVDNKEQLDLYKEVIEIVREYISELLQILDKVKEEK